MITTNSPLENLAAFAIVFAAGVMFTVGLSIYTDHAKADATRSAS